MEHPSDDLLSAYALDPILVPERDTLEGHLASCGDCRQRLADIRTFESQLADDEDVWPIESGDDRGNQLQLIADQIAREDAEAETLLKDLLEGPPEAFIWANLPEKPRYYTGGVARKLSAAADKASYIVPLHALNIADAAIAITGMLSEPAYPAALLASWRGTAWKQRANALRHLGRFPAAFEALERAEREYRRVPRPDFDLAAVTYIRATLYYEQEEQERARRLAAESTRAFMHLGQSEMYFASRLLEGAIAFRLGDLDAAELIFGQVYAHGEQSGSRVWLARAAQALGNCSIERRALDDATRLLHTSMLFFRELGITVEEIRCRWKIALVVQRSGRHHLAIERFRAARDEFLQLGGTTDAALVSLDLMETFVMLRKPREVRRAAGNIVAIFTGAGMLTGALAAANFLRQAASIGAVTPALLDYLRGYLRRVELQPDFAFVPPAA